jgi:hypothetical protein
MPLLADGSDIEPYRNGPQSAADRGKSARRGLLVWPLRCRRRGWLCLRHHSELGQNRGEVPVFAISLDQPVIGQFEDSSHTHIDLLPRARWQWTELPGIGAGERLLHDDPVA